MPASGPAVARPRRKIRRASPRSLAFVLFRNFGLLLVVAVAAVLIVGLWTAARNTTDLLQDKADLTIRQLEVRVSDHMQPGQAVVVAVAEAIEKGTLLNDQPLHFRHFLEGSLSGVPQIAAVMYLGTDLRGFGAMRVAGKVVTRPVDLTRDEQVRAAMLKTGDLRKAQWEGPFWRPQIKSTILVVRRGVFRDGKLIGSVLAMVRVRELSRYLKESTQGSDVHAYILLNDWRVLAHPELVDGTHGSEWRPTPALSELQDPVMRNMWDPAHTQVALLKARPPLKNHLIEAAGVTYIAFYKTITGYGAGHWTLGAYVRAESFGQQIARLTNSAIVGLVALLVAIFMAIWIGRRIARPVRRLSAAARQVAAFELDGVQDLPGSRVRELDEQSRAFNSMLGAMRWFQAYVPKTLVRRLVQKGDLSGIASDDRSLTVMFTDVVGFSTIAEGATAAQVAAFLNEHFDLVTRCIDAQDGTVDKFIGDSVMAFWGAPEKQKHRAERACRAALAVRRALAQDNARRVADGLQPVRMRIGIHSGHATVGNIGPADRVNYTAIGDMVNVAQRLEQLGKQVDQTGRDAVILISEDTYRDLDEGFSARAVGAHNLRGREAEIEVYELLDGPSGAVAVGAGAPA